MGMGRRRRERQESLWIPADDLPKIPRHVFYEKLNEVLAEGGFDDFVEELCEPYYKEGGRNSIHPGGCFRMLFAGYFEGIDSQRGIAWRCTDSLSLRTFPGCALTEPTPDHSSLTKIRQRLPPEVHEALFAFVLRLADEHRLLANRTVAVDATTLEANAAMKSIVRKESAEDRKAYLRGLMQEEGLIAEDDEPGDEEVRRFDKGRRNKKVSNAGWESQTDPESRIARRKDGRTHLAYKAEHVVDPESEFLLEAEVYHADEADTKTLTNSLDKAQANLKAAGVYRDIEEVVADKGYHANKTLTDCREWGPSGLRSCIPEPESVCERRWTDKPPEYEEAYRAHRRRVQGDRGKRLQKRRSEVVERSFAHGCETGGARRTRLRGLVNVRKRYTLVAAARNPGLMMRKLFGVGTPRSLQGVCWCFYVLRRLTLFSRTALRTAWTPRNRFARKSARFLTAQQAV